MTATTDPRLDTIETPEGRAIYPFGTWGAGYLVEDATERRLRAYLNRMIWILMGFFMLQSIIREFVFRGPELVALAVTYAAFLIFHYAVMKAIMRGTARASFRPSSDELMRLRLTHGGRTAMIATRWCGVVAFGAIAVGIAIVTEGWERWIVEVACAGALVLVAVSLRRVQRIPGLVWRNRMLRSVPSVRPLAHVAAMLVLLVVPAAAQNDIINYSKSDGRMNAAMAKSLAALPAFDAALEQHRLAILNVRVPYGTDCNEYLWLTDVRRNADGSYDGTITDVVAHVTYLHQGSPYHARRDQVAEWIFRDDRGGDHGGWTVRLMQEDSPDLRARNKFRFVD